MMGLARYQRESRTAGNPFPGSPREGQDADALPEDVFGAASRHNLSGKISLNHPAPVIRSLALAIWIKLSVTSDRQLCEALKLGRINALVFEHPSQALGCCGIQLERVIDNPFQIQRSAANLETEVKRLGFGVLLIHDLRTTLRSKGIVFEEQCRVFLSDSRPSAVDSFLITAFLRWSRRNDY